jgi:hypothetical protein
MTDNTVFDLHTLLNIHNDTLQSLEGDNIDLASQASEIQQKLQRLHDAYADSQTTSSGILTEQDKIIDLVNTEYQRLLLKKASIDQAIAGQKRAALLNDNFRLRYIEYTRILAVIIFTIVIIIILYQLQNSLLSFIPSFLVDFIAFVLCCVALVVCYMIYSNIMSRDPLYFDELNSQNLMSATKLIAGGGLSSNNNASGNLNLCVGEKCCSVGQRYDSVINKCVDVPAGSPSPTKPTGSPSPTTPHH